MSYENITVTKIKQRLRTVEFRSTKRSSEGNLINQDLHILLRFTLITSVQNQTAQNCPSGY